jgi:hypothetical protein
MVRHQQGPLQQMLRSRWAWLALGNVRERRWSSTERIGRLVPTQPPLSPQHLDFERKIRGWGTSGHNLGNYTFVLNGLTGCEMTKYRQKYRQFGSTPGVQQAVSDIINLCISGTRGAQKEIAASVRLISLSSVCVEGVMARTPRTAAINRESAPNEQSKNPTDSSVDVWHDIDWEPALHSLQGWQPGVGYTGKSDPRPLAKLLRSGKPVPGPVAEELGLWLDPPWGKKGPQITATLPKKYYPGHQSTKDWIAIKKYVKTLKGANRKLESAVQEVMSQTGRSRSYVMNAWRLGPREIVLRTSKFHPLLHSSPREPQQS